jgi:AraC-like DNA-binding protein
MNHRLNMDQPRIEKDVFPGLMLSPFHYACFTRFIGHCEDQAFLSHNCFQIILGLSGCLHFELKNEKRTIDCKTGKVFILSPGVLHNWISEPGAICENFMFFCDGFTQDDSDLGRILNLKKRDIVLCFDLKRQEYDFYVRQFRELIRRHDHCNVNVMHGLLYAFCGIICRRAMTIYGNLDEGDLHPALSRAVDLLKRDFRKRITLQQLSKSCCLGPSRLSELFRMRFGMSPMQYLLELRAEKAVQLLSYSNMNISEISEFLGFQTVQYFSRFLKKQTGSCPKEVLKNRKIV